MSKKSLLVPCLSLSLGLASSAALAANPSVPDLAAMPLDQLLDMQVSGVSKFPSTLADTAVMSVISAQVK